MTPAERREIKRGKHERIRELLNNLRAAQHQPVDDLMRKVVELENDEEKEQEVTQ